MRRILTTFLAAIIGATLFGQVKVAVHENTPD